MAAPINTFRTPLYGDKDAKLHNFRQKQRPPRAFLELVNDDNKSMEYCPINGVPLEEWDKPVQPLSDKAKQEYSNRKERGREKKEAAAKGAMLRKRRVRKKLSQPPGGGPPIPQPDAVGDAPATLLPVPDTPTAQPSTPSDGRAPSTALPQATAQVHSASPALVSGVQPPPSVSTAPTVNHSYQSIPATTESLQVPTTKSSHFDTSQAAYAMIYCASRGQESVSGTPLSDLSNAAGLCPPGSAYTLKSPTTRHMIPEASHAARAYRPQVATEACVASHQSPLPPRSWQATPTGATLHSTPGALNEFKQHTATGSYPQAYVVPRDPCAPAHLPSLAPERTDVIDNACTAPSPATSHAERYSGSSSRSPSSTWAQTLGFRTMASPLPTPTQLSDGMATAGCSIRATGYFPIAAYQGVTKAESHSPADTSMAMRTMRPVSVEYYYRNMVQQTNGEGAPQTNPTTTTNNTMAAISWHSAGEQGSHDVTQAVQSPSLPQGKDCSVPSAVPSYIDGQQSGVIERKMNNKYAYHQHTRSQYARTAPPTIVNANPRPPKHSTYSELSLALQYPTPTLAYESAPLVTKDPATSRQPIGPPQSAVGFYALPSSDVFGGRSAALLPLRSPYAQRVVINGGHPSVSTHLWPQNPPSPLQYPCTISSTPPSL